jgi:hypothetical protein
MGDRYGIYIHMEHDDYRCDDGIVIVALLLLIIMIRNRDFVVMRY